MEAQPWPQAQRQTWHVGNLYEKQRTFAGSSASEEHRYSVFAGGARIAEVKRSRPNDTAAFTTDITYLHHDRLGSLVASTDEFGEVTGEYTYGVFGQPNQALPVPYGYTGHRFESELGLTDAGGRFYDAKFGIFLSPDPVGPLNGGSTFGNRYSYVGYDPINFVDPTGFAPSGVDCLNPDNFTHSDCRDEVITGGSIVVILVAGGYCLATGECFEGDPGGADGAGGADGEYVEPAPVNAAGPSSGSDPGSSGGGGSGGARGGNPRIDFTADGQLFGASGSTPQLTSSTLLHDYYTPECTMVTCSVAGPGCSDGSGYVFGWTGNAYNQRGRELDSAVGAFAGELSLVPAVRTAFDSQAATEDRLWSLPG